MVRKENAPCIPLPANAVEKQRLFPVGESWTSLCHPFLLFLLLLLLLAGCLILSTAGVMAGQGLTPVGTLLPQFSKQTEASLLLAWKGKATFCTFIRTGCNRKGVNFPQNLTHCNSKQIFCSLKLLI